MPKSQTAKHGLSQNDLTDFVKTDYVNTKYYPDTQLLDLEKQNHFDVDCDIQAHVEKNFDCRILLHILCHSLQVIQQLS